MALPGFKLTTTTRSQALDAAVQLVFSSLGSRYRCDALTNLASISSGGTPSRSNASFYEGSVPWAKISDITAAGKWITSTEESITQAALDASTARVFPEGAVLFSLYGSIGKTAI